MALGLRVLEWAAEPATGAEPANGGLAGPQAAQSRVLLLATGVASGPAGSLWWDTGTIAQR